MTESTRFAVLAAFALALVPARPAFAAADPGADALRALFASPTNAAGLFSAEFANRIPPATIGRYVLFYEASIGIPTAIGRDGDDYELTAPRGSLRATIELDAEGKIATLRFHDEISLGNADALKRILESKALLTDWFAPTPSRDVAVGRTQKIVDGLHAALGAYERTDVRHGTYVAVFERGETHAQISADRSGRIVYLSFERS
jgi:hypothetical protein